MAVRFQTTKAKAAGITVVNRNAFTMNVIDIGYALFFIGMLAGNT